MHKIDARKGHRVVEPNDMAAEAMLVRFKLGELFKLLLAAPKVFSQSSGLSPKLVPNGTEFGSL